MWYRIERTLRRGAQLRFGTEGLSDPPRWDRANNTSPSLNAICKADPLVPVISLNFRFLFLIHSRDGLRYLS